MVLLLRRRETRPASSFWVLSEPANDGHMDILRDGGDWERDIDLEDQCYEEESNVVDGLMDFL